MLTYSFYVKYWFFYVSIFHYRHSDQLFWIALWYFYIAMMRQFALNAWKHNSIPVSHLVVPSIRQASVILIIFILLDRHCRHLAQMITLPGVTNQKSLKWKYPGIENQILTKDFCDCHDSNIYWMWHCAVAIS